MAEEGQGKVKQILKKHRGALRKLLAALFFLCLAGLGRLLMKQYADRLYPVYRIWSKKWIGLLAGLTSFSPIAVWDIVFLLLILLFLYSVIHMIRKRRSVLNWLANVILAVSLLVFAAVWGWMLNHYAPPLAEELGYTVRESDKEELYEAAEYYYRKAADYAVQMERDTEGHLVRPDFYETAEKAGSAYAALGEEYPVLKGPLVRVKKLSVIGEYLMYNGIIGMFMPLSGEAGVPGTVPAALLPFTMAHEAAHRCGVASEEEANFAAFLACVTNEDLRFQYSAYYSAFSYCFSSLYKTDPELAYRLYHKYDDNEGNLLVQLDRSDTRAVYDSYESSLKEISDEINDTYLKTFDEESGIQSYGEVTDDLLAYWRTIKEE